MATMEIHMFSEALKRNVTFNAIVPIDKRSIDGYQLRDDRPMKTLYLLHGVYGDCTEWQNFTRVALWAQDKNLCVIMPSGENKFYTDIENSNDYFGKFVGEELVAFTRALFHLSSAREDTYVAGLSMGGLGALLTGLRNPETFGYIGAFSSALILDNAPLDDKGTRLFQRNGSGELITRAEFYESSVGSLENLNPRNDVYALVDQCVQNGNIPKIYQAIGTSDFLLNGNRAFKAYLDRKGVEVVYEESEGAHEWNFWDKALYHFLQLLPLEPVTPARYSGYKFLKL